MLLCTELTAIKEVDSLKLEKEKKCLKGMVTKKKKKKEWLHFLCVYTYGIGQNGGFFKCRISSVSAR